MKMNFAVNEKDWIYFLILIFFLIDKKELVKILTLVLKINS